MGFTITSDVLSANILYANGFRFGTGLAYNTSVKRFVSSVEEITMNKLQTLLIAGVAVGFVAMAAPVHAVPTFNFQGSDKGGTGSAVLDFDISQDLVAETATIVVDIDNTSPILLDDESGPNAPGIVGFGFNTDPETLANLASWSLDAFDINGNLVNIGGSAAGSGTDWVLGTFNAGVTLEYLPQTGGVTGALYNPDAEEGLAALPNFFTTAVFTLNFAGITEEISIVEGGLGDGPFVRIQNVGLGGEGSLRLTGTPVPVPEPATLALLGIGLLGAGYMARRRRLEA